MSAPEAPSDTTWPDECFRPDHARRQIERIQDALTRVLFGDFTQVLRLPDGGPVWGNLAMHINVAVNAARNALARAEALREDLEESRRRLEEQKQALETSVEERTRELRQAYDDLEVLDKAKDSFLSLISHEMRTPLTSIRSFAEILLDFGATEPVETRTEFLTIIKTEAERLTRLINQILDLAKIEAGRMEWDYRTFDFREVVKSAVSVQSGLLHAKPVVFEVRLPRHEVAYTGDRDRLLQVVLNLVANAWKFSSPGGEVLVRLDEGAAGLELTVADQGPGVPGEEEKRVIFERFRQSGSTLTGKPAGTGLGLAISKEIVLEHGGEVRCEDNPGGGAVFKVLLPDRGPAAAVPAAEQSQTSAR